MHTPGVKVAIPSTPADAKGLLAAAIRDPDPVVIFEPKLHYRTLRGEVPEGEHVVPLGKARLAREGTDLTLVAYGSMVPLSEQAADALADEASVEVLDIRSLKPLDEDALLASAAKTGRVVIVQEAPRVAGFGAELAAILAEKAMLDLRGPVLRVTGFDVPVSVLADRGRVHALGRAGRRRGPQAARVLASDRAAAPLARAGRVGLLAARRRDAARPCAGDDERLLVVPLAGASYRLEALQDDAFAPGRPLALVPEPENEHDPNAVAVWDAERRLPGRLRPAPSTPPRVPADAQAVSLWEFRDEERRASGCAS